MSTVTYLEVVGGAVHLVRKTTEGTVPISELASRLSQSGMWSPRLPEGCVFYHCPKVNYHLFVIEQRPCARELVFDPVITERSTGVPRWLSLPYIVFVIRTGPSGVLGDKCQVFSRPAPLASLKDELFMPPLSNVGTHLNGNVICPGSHGIKVKLAAPHLMADEFIAGFWGTRFNHELRDHYSNCSGADNRLATPDTWEDATKVAPLFLANVPLPSTGLTLSGAIQKVTMP